MEPRPDIATTPPETVDLKALSEPELEAFVETLGEPAYRGRQLFQWLYGKGATAFEAMTSLPKAFRERLAETAYIGTIHLDQLQTATDGTAKGLFTLSTGRKIEAVLIPDVDADGRARRLTVCVSSQVGCAMGCTFCATGLMGFRQNLTAGEIYDQARFMDTLARERYGRGITNVVFMGMGEPLLNYDAVLRAVDLLTHRHGLDLSPKRVTVSTVGLARRIRQLADDGTRFHLAVSLHAPTDAQRSAIMPVNRAAATDLTALRDAIQHYTKTTGRRVTYEYCMFEGVNDSEADAHALADVVAWAPSKVNLIMYNPVEGLGFHRTPEDRLEAFIRVLVARGVTVTVRRSRGQDIDAACGQLAVETA
ncbi:MAG: 23S rRNA (adenine(2503)-C(2))-methyltransferase RlmN [Rhodothermales bacterium]|nr:23S rRNA (adenine(2503)-C(2))-methyltransferase RlmN [Rhodothermales bacterium]